MPRKGLIHLYIGNGKGKTSAALGLALRGCGAGKKICLVRFLKPKSSSELSVLKRLRIKVISYRERHPLFYRSASIATLRSRIAEDLRTTETIIRKNRYDLIILDEILYLSEKRLSDERDLLKIIKAKPMQTELILTGGFAGRRLLRSADYVSIIRMGKHPFNKGIPARKGIEF